MANPIKFQHLLAIIYLFGFHLNSVVAQQSSRSKEWSFQSTHGVLKVVANSLINNDGSKVVRLELSPVVGGTWTVAEEAVVLDSILANLPKEGFEIRLLASISLRLNEKDAISRLATHSAKSNAWRREVKTRNPARFYPLVALLLNESKAYEEINESLARRNLRGKITSIEKVSLEDFRKSGGSCAVGQNCANILVPDDALIQMDIAPLASQ